MLIIKRRGHTEEYDPQKLYASVYAACLSAGESEEKAESVAEAVTGQVTPWAREQQEEVSSGAIARQAIVFLSRYSPKAAFLYENRRADKKDLSV